MRQLLWVPKLTVPGLRCLGLLILLITPKVTATPTITFSCWISPDVPLYQQVETLFRDAFRELGYEFAMHYRPNQRSLMEAKTGASDGDCARTYLYAQEHPDSRLVRVDTMITRTSLEAWSNDPELKLTSEADLYREPWRIGYLRGNVAVDAIMGRHTLPALVPVASSGNGLKMLSAGRLDLFIGTSISTRQELHRLNLPNPIYSAGHVMTLDGHAYLNEKHRELAPALAEALRRLMSAEEFTFEP